MSDQCRFQRWEAGLLAAPPSLSERELDVCVEVLDYDQLQEDWGF